MIAAIGIVPKIGEAHFWVGILVSTVFCWFLKLFAVFAEQKGIGANFKSSVAIKKFIGVQTHFMKGIRAILSQEGCHISKMAVLVGGPDWPTSVITGIMDLPLLPMLIGSLPVVVVIFPCCISAGFLIKIGWDEDDEAQHRAVAEIMLIVAGMASGTSNMVAAYYVQKILADSKQELEMEGSTWMKDTQEDEVLAAVERDKEFAEQYDELTRWEVMSAWVRVVLVSGSIMASATVYIMVNPVSKAFATFKLTDKVSELPDGNVLEVV